MEVKEPFYHLFRAGRRAEKSAGDHVLGLPPGIQVIAKPRAGLGKGLWCDLVDAPATCREVGFLFIDTGGILVISK
jgi:hypothetical protein